MKWSVLFTKLELNSADFDIEDYTVSTASLAQVSLRLYILSYPTTTYRNYHIHHWVTFEMPDFWKSVKHFDNQTKCV